MNVTLYQIIPELDNDHLMFRNLQAILQASNHQVPAELYETVFSGELEVQSLQDIFTIFNIAHPEGYRGRSMSVSDVVEIPASTGENDFYFCEPIGYKNGPCFRLSITIIGRKKRLSAAYPTSFSAAVLG